jgi:hypothetical protein
MNLEKYICDLLFEHECVIVPGFGGFITNFEPARIHETNFSIEPPRKFVVFNSNLKINDGLLATKVSRHEACSFDEAMHNIRREVLAWNQRLKTGKTILLPGLGLFRQNKEGKTEFEPEKDQNFLAESFGLTNLIYPPLEKTLHGRKARTIFLSGSGIPTYKIRRMAMAAAITIPLLATGLWGAMHFDNLRNQAIQYSGIFSPPSAKPALPPKTEAVKSEAAAQPLFSEAFADDVSNQSDFTPAEESVPAFFEEISEATAPVQVWRYPNDLNERAYHVIVGSFESTDNSRQLIDDLITNGYNARHFESSKGMHRVSVASYLGKDEALAALMQIREESKPGAWIFRF